MRFMNDYDLWTAQQRYAHQPNRTHLVIAVDFLRMWADNNSDGWAYWPKPCRAAAKAMEAITGDGTNQAFRRPDLTDSEVTAALAPIKAFLTRQGVDWHSVIPTQRTH
jgi:hypothetical protein